MRFIFENRTEIFSGNIQQQQAARDMLLAVAPAELVIGFFNRIGSVAESDVTSGVDRNVCEGGVSIAESQIFERVKQIISDHLSVEKSAVELTTDIVQDLGADSLDTVELIMAMEEEFGILIPDDVAVRAKTVADAVSIVIQQS